MLMMIATTTMMMMIIQLATITTTKITQTNSNDPSAIPISKWSNNNEAIPLNKKTETTQKADSEVPPLG